MASAAVVVSVSDLLVESIEFPATVKPPAASKIHFLGGAGVRGLEIKGEFMKFTTIGVYLENDALQHLAIKWKGRIPKELSALDEFYRDIVTDVSNTCQGKPKLKSGDDALTLPVGPITRTRAKKLREALQAYIQPYLDKEKLSIGDQD